MDDYSEGFEAGLRSEQVGQMRQLRADRDRYRDAILDAIPKLASDHYEDMENHDCDLCWPKHDGWPCPSALVADELRAALDGEGTA